MLGKTPDRSQEGALVEADKAELTGPETRGRVDETLGSPAKDAEKRELTPEQQAEFLSTLKARFSQNPEHYKRPEGVNFAEVKASLEANPELIYSLAQMERTGGSPDVIAAENDAFIFGDCSLESPNRPDLTFEQADQMANQFGVDMMPVDAYGRMREKGRFDVNTSSWLARRADSDPGAALSDNPEPNDWFYVNKSDERTFPSIDGWRGVLRVPKA